MNYYFSCSPPLLKPPQNPKKTPSFTTIPRTQFANAATKPLLRLSQNPDPEAQAIADELISLTRLERCDHSILFRLKMCLNNYGPAVVASPSSSSAAGKSSSASLGVDSEEKMVFNVKLEKYDAAAKIKVINEVRGFTDLGLKEAKNLVEKVPAMVKKGVTKEERNAILDKLKQLGATVVLE